MSTAQAAVFGDDNLVRIVALSLPRSSIVSLRLTCRRFKTHFSQYLFRVLRLRFSSWYLLRLKWIATRKQLRDGVRELIFDTATYVGANGQDLQHFVDRETELETFADKGFSVAGLLSADLGTRTTQRNQLLDRHLSMTRDEVNTLAACMNDIGVMWNALRRLRMCNKITITPWSGPGEAFFNRPALLGEGNAMPPPLAALRDGRNAIPNQSGAYGFLLGDLVGPPPQFTELQILNTPRGVLGPLDNELHVAPMAISWHGSGILTEPIADSTLSRLRLELVLERRSHRDLNDYINATSRQSFSNLWFLTPNLRHLDLEVRVQVPQVNRLYECTSAMPLQHIFATTVFPQLVSLDLRSMWLEASDLANFVAAHSATLRHIGLYNINLGDTSGRWTAFDQVPWLIHRQLQVNRRPGLSRPFRHRGAGEDILGRDRPWEEVMRTCQAVRGLCGMALQGASVGAAFEVLSEDELVNLLAMGMDGRANEREVPHWSKMWE